VQSLALIALLSLGGVAARSGSYASDPAAKVIQGLFGPGLVRAEVITYNGSVADIRIDRGLVTRISGRVLTLTERDGRVVKLQISASAQVTIDGRRARPPELAPRMHATVIRSGNGPVAQLFAYRRTAGNPAYELRAVGSGLIRAEVVAYNGEALGSARLDQGTIEVFGGGSLTLSERDGSRVQMQIAGNAAVQLNGRSAPVSSLAPGQKALTLRPIGGAAEQIWASGRSAEKGKGKERRH
jgi:hypothetical protein